MYDELSFIVIVVLLIVLAVALGAILYLAGSLEECQGAPPDKDAKMPLGLFQKPQPYREPDRLAEVSDAPYGGG